MTSSQSQANVNAAKRTQQQADNWKIIQKFIKERKERLETLKESLRQLNEDKSKATASVTRLEQQNAGYTRQIAALNPVADAAQIVILNQYITNNRGVITTLKKTITTYTQKITTKKKELEKQTAGVGSVNSTSTKPPVVVPDTGGSRIEKKDNGGGANDVKLGYSYNAPLVKQAYFSSVSGIDQSLQGKSSGGLHIDAGNWNDAKMAWRKNLGGRGTIQMDRDAITAITEAQKSNIKYDPKMYGFKFLYNPKDVGMAWGIMDQMDPTYVASGQDAFNAISAGLMSSSVSFDLVLNRIEDLSYLNPDGSLKPGINPYPKTVAQKDLFDIYEKGTMYDIEYLFKTLNGPHSTFTSNLNGETADRGWLRPSIVELHLGLRMRYRVRVQTLSINHAIFDSRMVPIFSTVRLQVGRFNDGPDLSATQKVSSSSYGNEDGYYLGSMFIKGPKP
jgi:hypothetical protein